MSASDVPVDDADEAQDSGKGASDGRAADHGPRMDEQPETPLPGAQPAASPRSGAHPITGRTVAGYIVLTVVILVFATYTVQSFWSPSESPGRGAALGMLVCDVVLTALVAVPWWRWRWNRSRLTPGTTSGPSTDEQSASHAVSPRAASSRLLAIAIAGTVALGVAFVISGAWYAHTHAEKTSAAAIQQVIDAPLTHFSREGWQVSLDYPDCFEFNAADLADTRAAAKGQCVTFSWVTDADAESRDSHATLITLSRLRVAPTTEEQARDYAAAGATYYAGLKGQDFGGSDNRVRSAEAVSLDGRPAVHVVTRSHDVYPQNARGDCYIVWCPRCVVTLYMSFPEHDYEVYEASGVISDLVSSLQVP